MIESYVQRVKVLSEEEKVCLLSVNANALRKAPWTKEIVLIYNRERLIRILFNDRDSYVSFLCADIRSLISGYYFGGKF